MVYKALNNLANTADEYESDNIGGDKCTYKVFCTIFSSSGFLYDLFKNLE